MWFFGVENKQGYLITSRSGNIYQNIIFPGGGEKVSVIINYNETDTKRFVLQVVLNAADEFLRYGQDVQLVCRVPPEVTSGSDGCGSDVTLSYGISAEQLPNGLGSGSAVTASPFTEPCVRNCFKIRG